VIRRGSHDPALVEQMRAMAERQVGHMTRLVDDLLDLSRINTPLLQCGGSTPYSKKAGEFLQGYLR
jgi:signal transduction histidine kinase